MLNRAKMLYVIGLVGLLVLGPVTTVWACTCPAFPPPLEAVQAADVVFSGQVKDITPVARLLDVRFVTYQFWKGPADSTVNVRTANNEGACGYPFEAGAEYLVYANSDSTTGLHFTNLCMRTRPTVEAAEDFTVLDSLRAVPIAGDAVPPRGIGLSNYPNPFATATQIAYTLPEPGHVTLAVYDLRGRRVQTLVSRYQHAGLHRVEFAPGALPNGVYLYEVRVGTHRLWQRMMRVR